ncbi:MAG TPA: glycosyl hydrolase [Opitutaceae bacterium]|nr:glycosyl hydrolase [Opitutaceae bacterium]
MGLDVFTHDPASKRFWPAAGAGAAGARRLAALLRLGVALAAWLAPVCRAAAGPAAPDATFQPVTPGASPEAVALLRFMYGISGRHTLTGQHNYPNTGDASTRKAALVCGKAPSVFGQDFGFSAPGDIDAIAARPRNVGLVKRQYEGGAIIALCWHAVRPIDDEPVSFDNSVQGKLSDKEWTELTTPGTGLHKRWCAQVDVVAAYLKQLQAAHVPVLWRPYHEMNGDWFWWGGRPGAGGSTAIYRQLFDRLVNHHKINNLIWIWNVDRPVEHRGSFKAYFPGADFFDIASLDVYDSDFSQSYYDDLLRLAAGKPIGLAEVGPAPAPAVLERQPKWAWWMIWAEMIPEKGTPEAGALKAVVDDPRSWSLGDQAYIEATAPIRAASGLQALPAGRAD